MPSTSSQPKETDARSRDHNQGRQDRAYSSSQAAAVARVRKCKTTDYYAVLDIQTSATETEIRKAYRKLALVMHPDKNGAPGADEAFKMVSKAFQVLSDPDKKRIFDQTGADPESRGAAGMSGFSGFGQGMGRTAGAGGPAGAAGFSEDFAEEIFRTFFGMGGGGPGGAAFQTFGTPFGPNIRVQTFGRPPGAHAGGPGRPGQQEPQDFMSNLVRLLPLLLLFITPLLSSLFDSSSGSTGFARNTRFEFTPSPPYTERRTTYQHSIPYFVNPSDTRSMTSSSLRQLDHRAELTFLRSLRDQCNREYDERKQNIMDAQGWFWSDEEALEKARNTKLPACERLDKLGIQY